MKGLHNREGSGYAERTLARRYAQFLDHPLTAKEVWHILPPETDTILQPWVYGCDGKWLGRVGVFFIHRNVTNKENLFWSFMTSESYEAIGKDCATSWQVFLGIICLREQLVIGKERY